MIYDSEINATVQRQRIDPSTAVRSRLGAASRDFSLVQTIKMVIQPISATIHFVPDGRDQSDEFIGFFNAVQYTSPEGEPFNLTAQANDIKETDRIVLQTDCGALKSGESMRVDWVIDADNIGDHREAKLVRIREGAETGSAGDTL